MDNPFAVNRQTPGFNYGAQKDEATGYLDRFSQALGAQTPSNTLFMRNRDQLGLGDLESLVNQYQTQANTLMGNLRALPGQMSQRTSESLVNEGQRQRMIQAEAAPMMEQFGDISRAGELAAGRLAQGQQLAGTLTQLQLAEQEKAMLPFEKEYDLMTQRQAREFSGYTFQEQQELNRLLTNAQMGLQWTDAERNRAHQLAVKEKEYRNALDLMKEEYKQRESLTGVSSLF